MKKKSIKRAILKKKINKKRKKQKEPTLFQKPLIYIPSSCQVTKNQLGGTGWNKGIRRSHSKRRKPKIGWVYYTTFREL